MGRHHHHNHHHNKKNVQEEMNINYKQLQDVEGNNAHFEAPMPHFTLEDAFQIGNYLGINFEKGGYDAEQFRIGLDVELEHGRVNPYTNITNDDPLLTGKIVLAHLNKFPDYYKRLIRMEETAAHYWKK